MKVPIIFFLNKIKGLLGKMQARPPPVRLAGLMRPANERDLDNILRFFTEVGDPNVLPRPAEDYRRAVTSGLFYLVEVEGHIAAAAGIFFLREELHSPLEMGSCYVAPVIRGFGIQKLLIRVRVAASVAFLDPDADICTAVKPKNKQSINSILSAGFVPLTQRIPLLLEPCGSCPSIRNLEPNGVLLRLLPYSTASKGSGDQSFAEISFYLPFKER
jgi:hypothetical protein